MCIGIVRVRPVISNITKVYGMDSKKGANKKKRSNECERSGLYIINKGEPSDSTRKQERKDNKKRKVGREMSLYYQ
jgi:hypothetical protein